MNKSYMYANGNIHIFTDKPEKDVIEYVDRFDERLISQNKLEIIEKVVMKNETSIENLELNIKYHNLFNFIRTITYTSFGYVTPIFIDYFCKLDFSYLDANLNNFLFVSSLIGLAFGISKSFKNLKDLKNDLLEYKARKICKEKTMEKYNEEKNIYEQLLSINNKDLEDIYRRQRLEIKDLNSEEAERKIQEYFDCSIWYEMFKKDFIKKYEKGTFISTYKDSIDLSLLKLVEEMIKEELENKQKVRRKYAKVK